MSSEVFSRTESVFFVCGNGLDPDQPGGCTLQYVLDNGGFANFDKSLIMDEYGDPIATSNAASYNKNTGRVVCNSGEFEGAEVGMILYIEGADFDSPGRYEITAVGVDEVTIETGLDSENEVYNNTVNIGGSFNTLSNALDNITADDAGGKNNCYLFTNHNEVVTARPQVSGGGDVHLNSRLFITGFNTTLLDMMPGGAYYQSAYDAYKNGIDVNCHIKIDLNDTNSFLFSCNCVVVQNLRITNHTDGYVIEFASTVRGIVFKNCIADDANNLIRFVGTNPMICFIGCYLFDSVNDLCSANTLDNYIFFIGCILQSDSVSDQLLRIFNPGICTVSGCLLISAAHVFLNKGSFVEWDNTVIASASPVHFLHTPVAIHVGFNDIVILPQDGKFIHMGDAGGCSLLQDFHCLWGSDDAEFTGTYATNDETGGAVSRRDFNTIDIDPELDSSYRPRNPQVLRGGSSMLSDGLSQLGAIKQKYQFPQKGRTVNHGRLGILK